MTIWAGALALIIAALSLLVGGLDPAAVGRAALELTGVVGLFTLVCAAEAWN